MEVYIYLHFVAAVLRFVAAVSVFRRGRIGVSA
jgi:hypothetical protein